MPSRRFRARVRVRAPDLDVLRPVLAGFFSEGSVRRGEAELVIEAEGASAKDLNRALLSSLRRLQKRATIRAEWTSEDGTTERYFDYVLKRTLRE